MRLSIRQIHAVAALELSRIARSPTTLIAIIVFTGLAAAGQWLHWRTLPPRADDDRLLGYAFILAAMIGLRLGLSNDRKRGIEQLIVDNLIGPVSFFLGRLLSLIVTLSIFTAYAIIAASILSAGDWNFALWHTLLLALAVWIFTPLLLLVELVVDTRLPGPAVFVVFVVTTIIAGITVGVQPLIDLLGFRAVRLDYATLAPLAWRALIASGITALLYPVWYWRLRGRITTKHLF
jgi:hypothetical protein